MSGPEAQLPPTKDVRHVIATERPRISIDTVRFDSLRALVKVRGEIDRTTAAALWAVLQGHVASGRRFLRLDLSGVTSLDAVALTDLARAHHDLLGRRGTLVITGVRSLVARVLRMAGLDDQLLISGPRTEDDRPLSLDLDSRRRPSAG